MTREEELAANLVEVQQRISAAAASAGRDPEELTLVAVTKTWPSSDVRILSDLGVRHVAENRDQEASEKQAECADLPVRWHFVGRIQTNKAASIARYADVVESIDRESVVQALDKGAGRAGRLVDACIQVSLDLDPEARERRGGAAPEEMPQLAGLIEGSANLRLAGLMAVAPLGEDPQEAFGRFRQYVVDLQRDHPQARLISAGMSSDLEAAVASGATHVRIGTALLGRRAPVR